MRATAPRLLSALVLGLALGVPPVVHAGDAVPATPGQDVRLDEFFDGEVDWPLNLGTEFPGAQGTVTGVADQPRAGLTAVRLAGDFTKGGAYIDTGRTLPVDVQDTLAIRFQAMTSNVQSLTVRVIDATGQCHQAKGFKLNADGQWHDVALEPAKLAGGEHWGGANDGVWHGPAKSFHVLVGPTATEKQPVLMLADIRAEVATAATVSGVAVQYDFEAAQALGDWQVAGDVAIDATAGFKGTHSLRLARGEDKLEVATHAVSTTFPVAPGALLVTGACSGEMRSPDFSYNGQVLVEWLNAGGGVMERSEAALGYGTIAWQPFRKQLQVPAGAVQARLCVQLNKTSGTFRVDELQAAAATLAAPKPMYVERQTYGTAQVGNLLLPDDARVITVTAEMLKPLPPETRVVTWFLRDYWGAELTGPATAPLGRGPRSKRSRNTYTAAIDLAGVALELGKYYELVTSIAQPGGDAAVDNTSFAILPEAPSRKLDPADIPFTSRNWDNRLYEYFLFSDRIGIRVCGLWGGFGSADPGKISMPRIDVNEKLGMLSLSGVSISAIENHQKGYEAYTPEIIAQGTTAMVNAYAKRGLRFISLGNEPPTTEERARECVPFYKAAYQAAKSVDPTIQVIGTSVGATEAYFKAGFGEWCDVYDFHDYTDHNTVRASFARYHELFKQYGHAKPIVSTEIGVNSQGLSRMAISKILVKSISTFFACGGKHISWFDMMYPDPEGKNVGGGSDSMNVFNCRYNSYSPRLDALAYYRMVNGILVKSCVGERLWNGDIRGILFTDPSDACFLVIWKEKGRSDVFLPLPGTNAVQVQRMDGSASSLDAGGAGLTLEVSEEPLLLSYTGGATSLAEQLGKPAISLERLPEAIVKGSSVDLTFALEGAKPGDLAFTLPPGWSAKPGASDASSATWTVSAPADTAAREGRIAVSVGKAGELFFGLPVTGRLSVQMLPVPAPAGGTPGLGLHIRNNGTTPQSAIAQVALLGEFGIDKGSFPISQPKPAGAYFAEQAELPVEIAGGAERTIVLPLAGVDPQTIYRARAVVTDADGAQSVRERLVAGFAGVPRAAKPIAIDGVLDEADWQRSPVLHLNEARQFYGFAKRTWRGTDDISAEMRVLWDDACLYVSATVTDDVFSNTKSGGDLWAGDGLQFLIDPRRASAEKIGKYDIGMALTPAGPQTWCFGSADASAPAGLVPDVRLAVKPTGTAGNMIYELAIPWSRIAPFQPGVGHDLGLSMIINEDDGTGRDGFIGWMSGVHLKEVDMVGDLILLGD
jgi:hypothetical protein